MLYFGKITTSDPKITRKLLVYNKITSSKFIQHVYNMHHDSVRGKLLEFKYSREPIVVKKKRAILVEDVMFSPAGRFSCEKLHR